MIRRACRTCGTMQDFRKLDEEERAAVRAQKQDPRHYVDNLWRCTAAGCLWYQPYLHTDGGGILPERFKEEATAAE